MRIYLHRLFICFRKLEIKTIEYKINTLEKGSGYRREKKRKEEKRYGIGNIKRERKRDREIESKTQLTENEKEREREILMIALVSNERSCM